MKILDSNVYISAFLEDSNYEKAL